MWLIGLVTGSEYAKAQPTLATKIRRIRGNPGPAARHESLRHRTRRHGKIAWGRSDIGGHPVVAVLPSRSPTRIWRAAPGRRLLNWGERELDLGLALEILNRELGSLLLEGAGGSNGAFLQVGLIDEISLAICPAVDGVKGAQRSMTRLTTYLAICGPRSDCRDGIPLLSQCKARKQKMDVLGTQTKENFAILRIIKEIEMPNHGFRLAPPLPRKQWGCGKPLREQHRFGKPQGPLNTVSGDETVNNDLPIITTAARPTIGSEESASYNGPHPNRLLAFCWKLLSSRSIGQVARLLDNGRGIKPRSP